MTREIFDTIIERAKQHKVDFDFLLPAVRCVGENSLASEDEIFQAYFNSEIKRIDDNSPEAMAPASKKEVKDASTLVNVKPIKFFVKPGERVNQLHLDIYNRLVWTKAYVITRFILKAGSGKINEIIIFLCGDIIQALRNNSPSAN
jgi:hypothetical protein